MSTAEKVKHMIKVYKYKAYMLEKIEEFLTFKENYSDKINEDMGDMDFKCEMVNDIENFISEILEELQLTIDENSLNDISERFNEYRLFIEDKTN